MIILDDRLALEVLAGRLSVPPDDGPVATTWSFHYRLVRALADDRRMGALSGDLTHEVRRLVAAPPVGQLAVLDPRPVTTTAAQVAVRHGLNLLAAELVGAALVHDATVRLSAANVGRNWVDVMAAEGVPLEVS